MTDKKWLVPDVIDPVGRICVQLEIPDDMLHIAAFFGALELLGEAYNWEDSYADGSGAAYVWQAIIANAANLVRIGENCMDCETLHDCFTVDPLALAHASALSAVFDGNAHSHIDDLDVLYDDVTAQSVFAGIPTTAPSADVEDDLAFCYAVHGFVSFYAALKLHGISLDDDSGSFWDRIRQAANFVWDELKTFAGSIWGILTGTVSTEDAKSSLIDDTEIDTLACCLHDAMRDAPLTETTWNSALAACASVNNAGEILNSDNSTRTYLYFLETFNEALQRQIEGDTLTCICDEEWCYLIDFAVDNGGFTADVPAREGRANYTGTAWESTHVGPNENLYIRRFMNPTGRFTYIKYKFWAAGTGTSHTITNELRKQDWGDADKETGNVETFPVGPVTYDWTMDYVCGYIFFVGINTNTSSKMELRSVEIHGIGVNPFGADNCP